MDKKYIAGFFDGEGSAMVLTIRRKLQMGEVYRFWPTIKIAQKYGIVLSEIREYLGCGYLRPDKRGKTESLIIRGLTNIIDFADQIGPFVILKKDALAKVRELAIFQQLHTRNVPYTLAETSHMVDLRDSVFQLNQLTRKNLKQKYPKDTILNNCAFVDTREWVLKRAAHGAKALEEAGKPFRFKKGVKSATHED